MASQMAGSCGVGLGSRPCRKAQALRGKGGSPTWRAAGRVSVPPRRPLGRNDRLRTAGRGGRPSRSVALTGRPPRRAV